MLLALAVPAVGAPIDDKRAQAAQIAAQIDALDVELEIAAEDYNEAKSAYDAVTAKVTANDARQAELTARQSVLQGHLATRVASMYRQGPLGTLELLLGASSFDEFATLWDFLQSLNDSDAANVEDLKQTRADLQVVQQELAAQQAEAKAYSDAMKANKDAIEAQLAERQNLLSGIEAEIAEMVRARGLAQTVIISSFNPWALARMKRVVPELACALLYANLTAHLDLGPTKARHLLRAEAVHPHLRLVTPRYIARAQRHGLRVNVWTVNEETEMQRLIALGVDGLITDHPALLRRVLGY